ncbi:MAG: VWA domain-containing protein [bacterium]
MNTKVSVKRWTPIHTALVVLCSVFIQILYLSPAYGSSLTFNVRPENRTVLVPGPGDGTIQIKVVAPEDLPYPTTDRPLLNLALVIDKSGSMNEAGKMEYAIRAAHQLVDRLGRDDYLSIIAYDQFVRVVSPARRVRDRRRFHQLINNIYPGGRTFLSGGLEEGFRQARRVKKRGYVNRVLLISDGLANVGVTNRHTLRRRAGDMSERGISVSTFGVGYDFDEDLMAGLAIGGSGSYHYIANPSDIVAALSNEFSMASRTVATDVEIVIRLKKDSRFDSVLGHSWRREGDSVVIRLGDLSSGEKRNLMAKFKVQSKSLGMQDVADVSMRYRDPVSGMVRKEPFQTVKLQLVEDPDIYRENFDNRVREEKSVIESNANMEKAARRVDSGDRAGALSILKKAADALKQEPASPATEAEIQRNERYQEKIVGMDEMDDDEVKEMQKDIKYRSYQRLHRQ